jgi:hypothetical protein
MQRRECSNTEALKQFKFFEQSSIAFEVQRDIVDLHWAHPLS